LVEGLLLVLGAALLAFFLRGLPRKAVALPAPERV